MKYPGRDVTRRRRGAFTPFSRLCDGFFRFNSCCCDATQLPPLHVCNAAAMLVLLLLLLQCWCCLLLQCCCISATSSMLLQCHCFNAASMLLQYCDVAMSSLLQCTCWCNSIDAAMQQCNTACFRCCNADAMMLLPMLPMLQCSSCCYCRRRRRRRRRRCNTAAAAMLL